MYRDRGVGRRKREVDRNIGRNGDTVRGTEGQGQEGRDRGTGEQVEIHRNRGKDRWTRAHERGQMDWNRERRTGTEGHDRGRGIGGQGECQGTGTEGQGQRDKDRGRRTEG